MECLICSENYDDRHHTPRILPCAHTFCSACLHATIMYGNGSVTCPLCKARMLAPLGGAESFPRNYALQEILQTTTPMDCAAAAETIARTIRAIENTACDGPVCTACQSEEAGVDVERMSVGDGPTGLAGVSGVGEVTGDGNIGSTVGENSPSATARATHVCRDCGKMLCMLHQMLHSSRRATRTHRVDALAGALCEQHFGGLLDVFCGSHGRLVCRACCQDAHRSCATDSVEAVFEVRQPELQALQMRGDEWVAALTAAASRARAQTAAIAADAVQARDMVARRFARMHAALQQRQQALERAIEAGLAGKTRALQTHEAAIRTAAASMAATTRRLKERVSQSTSCSRTEEPVDLVQVQARAAAALQAALALVDDVKSMEAAPQLLRWNEAPLAMVWHARDRAFEAGIATLGVVAGGEIFTQDQLEQGGIATAASCQEAPATEESTYTPTSMTSAAPPDHDGSTRGIIARRKVAQAHRKFQCSGSLTFIGPVEQGRSMVASDISHSEGDSAASGWAGLVSIAAPYPTEQPHRPRPLPSSSTMTIPRTSQPDLAAIPAQPTSVIPAQPTAASATSITPASSSLDISSADSDTAPLGSIDPASSSTNPAPAPAPAPTPTPPQSSAMIEAPPPLVPRRSPRASDVPGGPGSTAALLAKFSGALVHDSGSSPPSASRLSLSEALNTAHARASTSNARPSAMPVATQLVSAPQAANGCPGQQLHREPHNPPSGGVCAQGAVDGIMPGHLRMHVWIPPDAELAPAPDSAGSPDSTSGVQAQLLQDAILLAGLPGTQLAGPVAVALGPDQTVFVVDCKHGRVHVFAALQSSESAGVTAPVLLRSIGDSCGPGQLVGPEAVAVAQDGTTYVLDAENHRIQVFSPEGLWVASWGGGGRGPGHWVREARGLAVGSGCLYVADHGNHRIVVFSCYDGAYVTAFGTKGRGAGQFQGPSGVAVREDGLVGVADWGNDRVQLFQRTAEGTEYVCVRSFGRGGAGPGQLQGPAGLAFGPLRGTSQADLVWVADSGNDRVQLFDSRDGEALGSWGTRGSGCGQLQGPSGLAVDTMGCVYISDYGNHCVQVLLSQVVGQSD